MLFQIDLQIKLGWLCGTIGAWVPVKSPLVMDEWLPSHKGGWLCIYRSSWC